MSYLEIKNLEVSFGDLQVVKKVDLNVEKGQLITFLGPSGCGKTTLMRTIAGLEKQSAGTISLDGEEVQETPARLRNMGMVFQSYALFPNMTVFENIAFGLRLKKLDQEVILEKVNQILELVELTERKNFYPKQLSGGQQQRVSLARALVVEPKVLLLDEPLSALDAKIRKQIQVQLRKIQRELGITMIFVTHDQEEAMVLSDVVYVMEAGKIAQGASPQELYSKPKTTFVAEFIGNYNRFTHKEIMKIFPDFGLDFNQVESFSLRPELIRLKRMTAADTEVEVEFISVQILGNIVRTLFKAGDKEITADFLNESDILQKIEKTQTIYINPLDLLVHKKEAVS